MATEHSTRTIEHALGYLVDSNHPPGINPTPAILHSIRVGYSLLRRGYGTDLAVAGILHEILEDSESAAGEIEHMFGAEVRRMVVANTADTHLDDRHERNAHLIAQCIADGDGAMIIHAADMLDCLSDYYSPDDETVRCLMEKTGAFLEITKAAIGREPIWMELNDRYQDLKQGGQAFRLAQKIGDPPAVPSGT